jgi:hypothetical protein
MRRNPGSGAARGQPKAQTEMYQAGRRLETCPQMTQKDADKKGLSKKPLCVNLRNLRTVFRRISW